MRLRTRVNWVLAGLSGVFIVVLIAAEIENGRASVREEIEAANRVATHLLGQLASVYSHVGGRDLVLQFLQRLGRVRANEVTLLSPTGEVLYRSPPATYKAGRAAPAWFAALLSPHTSEVRLPLNDGLSLVIDAQSSRAVLDAWDDTVRLLVFGAGLLIVVNGLAFWGVARVMKPFPIIAEGLNRIQQGDLAYRLPPLHGYEAGVIGNAFNGMAQAVEGKVKAERHALEAEARLEERRKMAVLSDRRIEEERHLIAHELHDEFGQSVTAIRSLALTIVAKTHESDPASSEVAHLISDEAARLYDAMHGLIPRLAPLSLDAPGLISALENLSADWGHRYAQVALTLDHELPRILEPATALVIYRVIQEGIINALRHANPTRVHVAITNPAHNVVISIEDDGQGIQGDWSTSDHFGLRGLTDRVNQAGGTFIVGNVPSGGVKLTATLPVSNTA
jgi:two-component system, NarL family, sensor histidine kinase UhpB